MTTPMALHHALHTLIDRDTALLAALDDARTAKEAARIVAQSARRHGIDLDEAALETALQTAQPGPNAASAEWPGARTGRPSFLASVRDSFRRWRQQAGADERATDPAEDETTEAFLRRHR